LKRAVSARFSGRRFAFLDLGCGDATALAPLFQDATPSRYKGVDLSETALALAARTLEALPCPVTLGHGDILAALAEHDALRRDLFQLRAASFGDRAKGRVLPPRLAPGGMLLLVDTMREEDETLDDYVRRYCAWLRREWAGLSARRRNLSAITSSITTGPSLFDVAHPGPRGRIGGRAWRRASRRALAHLFCARIGIEGRNGEHRSLCRGHRRPRKSKLTLTARSRKSHAVSSLFSSSAFSPPISIA